MITFDRDISPLQAEALEPKPFVGHIQLSGPRGGFYRPSWEQLLGFLIKGPFKNTLRVITNISQEFYLYIKYITNIHSYVEVDYGRTPALFYDLLMTYCHSQ